MQIQYCDACNLRISTEDFVESGGHVYCKACAAKNAAARGGPSGPGSGQHPASQRASPGAGTRRSPGGGTAVPVARAGARISPSGTARPSASGSRQSAARIESSKPGGSGSLIAWLAMAGAIFTAVAVALIIRSRGTAPTPAKPEATKTASSGAAPTATDPKREPERKEPERPEKQPEKPPEIPAADPVRGSSLLGGGNEKEMSEIRENALRRMLNELIALEKEGKLSALQLHQRYENFISSNKTTAAGKEAIERLKTLPPIVYRSPDNPAATQPGLVVKFHEKAGDLKLKEGPKNQPLGKLALPEVNFGDREGIERAFKRAEHIVLDINGFLEAPKDDVYTLVLQSDDGSVLYVGGEMLIDNDGDHGMDERQETVALKAGKHKIRICYYQGHGGAGLRFHWFSRDISKQIVPPDRLSHVPEP